MFYINLEKKSKYSKKSSKYGLKIRAAANLAMAGNNHCRDKAKNYCNKEISKWPENCCNNRFFVATKNWQNSFVNKRILSQHFTVCRDTVLGKDN